ncbi:MAG: triacylglycerol lipase [Pseudomonadales bacterium]|nr:triacylglycerol lipase [Pseudomonadales bacterium]
MKYFKSLTMFTLMIYALLYSQVGYSGWFSPAPVASTYAKTNYPIVIVGGALINFDTLGPFDYFHQIPQALEHHGAEVFVTTISASHSNEVRGEQLARLVEEIRILTGAEKVNLLTISMGGPTARYVASVYPEMVASVSTIDGGHQGIPLADLFVNGEKLAPKMMSLLYSLGNLGVGLIGWLAGDNLLIDTKKLAYSESTAGSQEFNGLYPEGAPTGECGEGAELASNGVYYYSMAGAKSFTNFFDPTDYVLYALDKLFFRSGEPNDGIIGSCSSHWGRVIRDDYPMNHMDIANHLFGLTKRGFNPVDLYIQQANRLKNKGL